MGDPTLLGRCFEGLPEVSVKPGHLGYGGIEKLLHIRE